MEIEKSKEKTKGSLRNKTGEWGKKQVPFELWQSSKGGSGFRKVEIFS